jgi:hypothetical protein
MSKVDLIRYKAIDHGWTKKDLQRVEKKIKELSVMFDGSSIMFKDIDELAMMLDEEINYKLEFSLIHLCLDEKIFLTKSKRTNNYYLEIRTF